MDITLRIDILRITADYARGSTTVHYSLVNVREDDVSPKEIVLAAGATAVIRIPSEELSKQLTDLATLIQRDMEISAGIRSNDATEDEIDTSLHPERPLRDLPGDDDEDPL